MRKKYVPYLFILPWIIGFIMFFLLPIIFSLVMSFCDSGSLGDQWTFVGFENYKNILTSDEQFRSSMSITLKYACILVPINLFISLGLALILNTIKKGHNFYKAAFYIPSVISGVALAIIWGWILADAGILNYIITLFGGEPKDWLDDSKYALFAVILTTIWSNGTMMLIFLSALRSIDREIIESCKIDGASKTRVFFKVTLPLISSTLLFNLIMAIIAALQQITVVMNLTGQGPNGSTYLYSMYVYNTAFQMQNFGYAAALSWIMFIVIMILTLIAFKSSKKWAYYEN